MKTDETSAEETKKIEKQVFILWSKGIYSLTTKRKLLAPSVTKHTKDNNLFILGNGEICIEDSKL